MSAGNAIAALFYLRATSLRNVLVTRFARLKEPKYLIGAVVGVGYFYWLVFARMSWNRIGHSITSPEMRVTLFALSAALLIACLVLGRYLVTSRFGRVLAAIRDAESRDMFIGYNPLHYKLFIWTLSAVLCGIAGALYVPQVGIINPSEMSTSNSIEIAVWVAVGGRGTLVGAVLGAGIVNLAKSWFTVSFPEYWLFFLGFLFIGVTLYLPDGVVGLWRKLNSRRACAPPLAPIPETTDVALEAGKSAQTKAEEMVMKPKSGGVAAPDGATA
jgi:urea transport system permease protein